MRNSRKMNRIKLLTILFVSAFAFNACTNNDDDHDDHDDHDHEHEEITRVVYTLTNNANASDVVTFTFDDPDGEGGANGTTTVSGALTAGATYSGSIQMLHIDGTETEDIGAEIAADEADEHEIFYINNAGMTITKSDVDANSNPVGFDTTVVAGTGGTGTLTIALIHEGKKPNNGTVADALSGGGTTDIEITFNVTVQ